MSFTLEFGYRQFSPIFIFPGDVLLLRMWGHVLEEATRKPSLLQHRVTLALSGGKPTLIVAHDIEVARSFRVVRRHTLIVTDAYLSGWPIKARP